MRGRQRGGKGPVSALLIGIFFLSAVSLLVHHATASTSYYVASSDAAIDPGSSDFITSSIRAAQSAGADHFVLVLNTFGGDGQSMDNIVAAISSYQASGGTFITLIAPSGAHAFSAGSYIAEASNRIYMTPGTVIGSATPIVSGIPTGEENTTMAKDISGFTAYMQALTSKNGRNETATGLMVTKGVSYTAPVALRLHVIDGLVNSSSISDALGAVGAPAGVQVQTPSIRSQLISVLSDPNLSGILFLLGVFAILADLYHPTVVLSVVGAAAILLALFGLGTFGAPLTAVALMFIGSLFIFLEVKTHHGVSALAGVVIFAVGFLLVFQPPPPATEGSPPTGIFFGPSFVTYILLALLGAGIVIASLYLYRIRRDLHGRRTSFDPTRMIGKEGYLKSDLKAGGEATANIESEDWTVTAAEGIPKGSRVKVKEAVGLKLVVEKE